MHVQYCLCCTLSIIQNIVMHSGRIVITHMSKCKPVHWTRQPYTQKSQACSLDEATCMLKSRPGHWTRTHSCRSHRPVHGMEQPFMQKSHRPVHEMMEAVTACRCHMLVHD